MKPTATNNSTTTNKNEQTVKNERNREQMGADERAQRANDERAFAFDERDREEQKLKLRMAVKKGKAIEEERDRLRRVNEENERVFKEQRERDEVVIQALKKEVVKLEKKIVVAETVKDLEIVNKTTATTTTDDDDSEKRKKERLRLIEENESGRKSIERLEFEVNKKEKEDLMNKKEIERMRKEIDSLQIKLNKEKDLVKVSKRREADALVGGAALETAEKKAIENEELRMKFERERNESLEKYEIMKDERDRAIAQVKQIEHRTALLTKKSEEARQKFEEETLKAKESFEKTEAILRDAEHRIQTAEERANSAEQEAEKMIEDAENRNRKFSHLQNAFQEREKILQEKIETFESAKDDRIDGMKTRLQLEIKKREEFEKMYEDTKVEVKSLRASMGAMESNAHAAVAAREHATAWKEKAQSAIAETENLREKMANLEESIRAYQQSIGANAANNNNNAKFLNMEKEIAQLKENVEIKQKQIEDAELRAHSALNASANDPSFALNGVDSNMASHQARKLAESEHTVLKQQNEIQALTRRVKDLSWQISMFADQQLETGVGSDASLKKASSAAGSFATLFSGNFAGGNTTLANLKGKRRTFVVIYLGVLHLLVYVAFLHGAFSAHRAVTAAGCRRM